ncbi:hypothetical protein Y032_0495g2474 [Ancylostoma ceylanicum]|uniref:Uncharacterized protein n=1 Tax=Ancylostoma ceylanicum TaxID=53326 RepID=A0A016WUQ0_9BILA|nr:hypothetical protein Y032_0495g2474 [Ancylostoma ceylanicum]
MKIIILATLLPLIKAAQDCRRTQLFSFGARFKSSRSLGAPWNEHIAAMKKLGTFTERETFAHIMGSHDFMLLIEGYMLANNHKLVSFYHLMGKSKDKVAHFFYKRWPKERILSRSYIQFAKLCRIRRPVTEKLELAAE